MSSARATPRWPPGRAYTAVVSAYTVLPLDHRDRAVAERIHAVLKLAYAQEAALLGVGQFEPLNTSIEDVQHSRDFHLGAVAGEELLGALSVGPDDEPDQLCIALLVVHPRAQRQGVGRALVTEALQRGAGMVFAVSTAAGNAPALALYRALGFVDHRRGTVGVEQLALIKLRRRPDAPRA